MPSAELLLLVQAAATLFMAGLIWFVQVVHYPLFGAVDPAGFPRYEAAHMRRTSWVVTAPMFVELGAAVLLVLAPPPGVPAAAAWAGAGLVAIIWASTAGLQAPRHVALRAAFDARRHAALVRTNWIRTAAWSARAVLVLWMLAQT